MTKSLFFGLCLMFFGGGSAFGSETDYQGLVAVKPTASHPDANAKIIPFRSYEYSDPRFVFFTGNRGIEVTKFQAPSIYVLVRLKEENLIRPSQAPALRAQLAAAELFAKRFPHGADKIRPEISELENAIKRLELRQTFIDGLWLSEQDAEKYLSAEISQKSKAPRLSTLQKEIARQTRLLEQAERSAIRARSTIQRLRTELESLNP